jgi:hypothetical protein
MLEFEQEAGRTPASGIRHAGEEAAMDLSSTPAPTGAAAAAGEMARRWIRTY